MGVSDCRLDVPERGGGHSDMYRMQQGGVGGLKIEKNVCVINGRPHILVKLKVMAT